MAMHDMTMMYVIGGVGIVVIGFLRLLLFHPSRIGARGERRVAARLQELGAGYVVLNDLYLPVDGATTQIDHVVVCRQGVFVVETKNYSGWIFGGERDAKWTQTFRGGKRNQFQNPIRQNYRHICAIADNLGISRDVIHGVVVFAGDCTFKTAMPANVVRPRQIGEYIAGFRSELLTPRQIEEVSAALSRLDAAVGEAGRAAHVANLRSRHAG